MGERIYATYWLQTGDDPGRAAEVIAGEQSSGTFVALAAETPELKARAGARVEQLEFSAHLRPRACRHRNSRREYTSCRLKLSWPIENLGPSLTALMATVAGNLYELREVTGLRLLIWSCRHPSRAPIRGPLSAWKERAS